MGNISVYVDDDGKLHFKDKDGADSVLPFSSDINFDYLTSGLSFTVTNEQSKKYKRYICIFTRITGDYPSYPAFSINAKYSKLIHQGSYQRDGDTWHVSVKIYDCVFAENDGFKTNDYNWNIYSFVFGLY